MHPCDLPIRVFYADTDAMGIVYHTSYIRWFEMGRTELMRARGISWSILGPERCYFPLTKVSCHFLIPARYDELVILETKIDEVKRASLSFSYRILDEAKERVLVRGYTLHACTDGEGTIMRIPETIKKVIQQE